MRRLLLLFALIGVLALSHAGAQSSSSMSKAIQEKLRDQSATTLASLGGYVQTHVRVQSLTTSAQQIAELVKGASLGRTQAVLSRWTSATGIDVFKVQSEAFTSSSGSVGSVVELLGEKLQLVSSWKSSDGRFIHLTATSGEKIDLAAVTFDQKLGNLWGWTNDRKGRTIIRPVVDNNGFSAGGYHMAIRTPPMLPQVDVVSRAANPAIASPAQPLRRYAEAGSARSDSSATPSLDKPLTIYVVVTHRAFEDLQRLDGQTPSNLVDNEVGSMELAFKRAGINVSVSEAVVEQTQFVERLEDDSVTLESIAKSLDTSISDPALVAVRKRRAELKRDIGILLVSWRRADECGNASGIGATAEHAFAVVNWGCIHNAVAYLHEIGHLLGAYHEIVLPESAGVPRDARAFFYSEGQEPFVTVMGRPQPAQNLLCGPIAAFSNPYDSHRGIKIGQVGKYDNARVVVEGLKRAVEFGESLSP